MDVSGLRGVGRDDLHAVVRVVALAATLLTVRVADVVAVLLVELDVNMSKAGLD